MKNEQNKYVVYMHTLIISCLVNYISYLGAY